MIANLLITVIVGGYETFVSRLRLEDHPDQPEWLFHVNAGVLKVKLATALIDISSIHLLKTFIAIGTPSVTSQTVLWQVVIHLTFVASALLLAFDRPHLVRYGGGNARKRPLIPLRRGSAQGRSQSLATSRSRTASIFSVWY
jgi:uncharacterized protein (TIGR00645 family)